jgi:hypothetical protein
LDFTEIVETYLQRNELDSITYLPDPQDPSKMIFIIQHYSKFELQTTIEASRYLRKTKFDRYDRNNDDSARNWLLNSLDPELKDDVTKRVKSSDGFCVNWLQMIRLVQSTSFNRFETIKREIQQDLTIFKFPGQSVKDLASAFMAKAKELENFGMC